MKKTFIFFAFCGIVSIGASAQVQQATSPDFNIGGVTSNTGIAIPPHNAGSQYDYITPVFDDPSGNYTIQWHSPTQGLNLHQITQAGHNPDVAYSTSAEWVYTSYEWDGHIWVDEFQHSGSPLYSVLSKNLIASGKNSNIDINSWNQGVVTWEDQGHVWMCSFDPLVAFHTPVQVSEGTQPDIAMLDDETHVVLTYINPDGQLIIETYEYSSLVAGSLSQVTSDRYISSKLGFSHPRVQGNRHINFGSTELFTVVVQEELADQGTFNVWGYFHDAPGSLINTVHVNDGVNNCWVSRPLPVVAYDRAEVHIAFAQNYDCPNSIGQSGRDVLMVQFDHNGAYATSSTTPGPFTFQQVNRTASDFTFASASINTPYDAGYWASPGVITNSHYLEGICFNDATDFYAKRRSPSNPTFIGTNPNSAVVNVDKEVTSNFVSVEVSSQDGIITEENIEMEFAVYDQSGRIMVEPTFEKTGMMYRVNIGNLSDGIYLLKYTLNGVTKAERIPHFKK